MATLQDIFSGIDPDLLKTMSTSYLPGVTPSVSDPMGYGAFLGKKFPSSPAVSNAMFQQKIIQPELSKPWESTYWNPSVDDPSQQAVKDRVYNKLLEPMGWEALLQQGFQRPGAENLTPTIYDDIVKRVNATGWDDATKKSAVLKGINDHYAKFGSGFTEYSTPEGMAGLFGLPDYNNAVHGQQDQTYRTTHAEQAKLADEESFQNAMMIAAAAAGIGGGFAGLYGAAGGAAGAGAGGITADSIAAGMLGGENAAGAMYGGLGSTVTGSIPGGADTMQSLWQTGQTPPASTAGGEIPWGVNAAKDTAAGGAMYADPIEGLIDLTNQGLTGEQAISALSEINPAWTQTGLEFLLNNPGELFGSGSGSNSLLKSLLGSGGGKGNEGTDLLSLLGKLGGAGLGAYASNEQAKSLSDLANKYSEYGAPSRARFEASMTPGFDPMSIPGYSGALDTASKGILARLSATGGNPYGNPGGLIEANKQIVSGTALPAINEYQRLNLSAGGLGNLNAAVPGLQTSAIGQEGNIWNSLGYGLNAATAPKQMSLADLYKSLGIGGLA